MSFFSPKYLVALLLLVIAVIPLYHAAHCRRDHAIKFPVLRLFSTGILLGLAVVHLLGDAIADTQRLEASSIFPILSCLTALACLGLAHYFQHAIKAGFSALLVVMLLILHAFFTGVALEWSLSYGAIYFFILALVIHKWAESIAVVVTLSEARALSLVLRYVVFSLFALATPLGILIANRLEQYQMFHGLIHPIGGGFAAGVLIYYSWSSFYGVQKKLSSLPAFLYVMLGFTLMACLSIWV